MHTAHLDASKINTFYCLTFAPINTHRPVRSLLPCHLVQCLHQLLAWLVSAEFIQSFYFIHESLFASCLQGQKLGLCLYPCHLLLLALSCHHCTGKHWFPLHKCFFLVPGSPAPASIVMCSHVHMCACMSGHIRKAVKTLPYTTCLRLRVIGKWRQKQGKGSLEHYRNQANATPVFKNNTCKCSIQSQQRVVVFSAFICHGSMVGLKGRPRCMHTKVFSGLQDYDLRG